MIWTTKDGRRLNINAMTSSHIHNCILLLKGAAWVHSQEMLAALTYPGHGEQATYCAERAADEAGDRMIDCEQRIRVMEMELERRGRME